MNDKELLELAAKAIGIELRPMEIKNVRYSGDDRFIGYMADTQRGWWNPLTDDGDALRLAVKLKIDISLYYGGIETVWVDEDLSESHETWEACDDEYDGCDARNAATRRAIVRAAAEIGKAQQ